MYAQSAVSAGAKAHELPTVPAPSPERIVSTPPILPRSLYPDTIPPIKPANQQTQSIDEAAGRAAHDEGYDGILRHSWWSPWTVFHDDLDFSAIQPSPSRLALPSSPDGHLKAHVSGGGNIESHEQEEQQHEIHQTIA